MGAVGYVVARQWRGSKGPLLALTVLVSVTAGLVLAALAGARRTETAFDRFMAASRPADATVYEPGLDIAAVAALPAVEASVRSAYVLLRLPDLDAGVTERIVPFSSPDPGYLRTIDRPMVLHGRLFDASAVDEAVVSEEAAERHDLHAGATVRVAAYSAEEAARLFDGEEVEPGAAPVVVRITGVVRLPADLAKETDGAETGFVVGQEVLYLSPAFYRSHATGQLGPDLGLGVRLKGGAGAVAGFHRDVEALHGRPLSNGIVITERVVEKARSAIQVQASSLYLFAAFAGAAMLLTVGRMLGQTAAGGARADVWRALGMDRRERAVAVFGAVALPVGAGVAGAGVLAALTSPLFPAGFAGQAELDPGFALDATALGGGGVALAAFLLAAAAPAAWRATAAAAPSGADSPRLARTVSRVARRASATIGLTYAFEAGGRSGRVPVRSAIASGALAVGSVAAAAAFLASLDRAADVRELQGWTWDLIVDGDEATAAEVAGVDGVTAAQPGTLVAGRIGDEPVNTLALRPPPAGEEAAVRLPVQAGRPPRAGGEVALSTRVAERLGAGLGDRIVLSGPGGSARLTVVGTVVFPATLVVTTDRVGDGVLVGPGTLARIAPEASMDKVFVEVAPGPAGARAAAAVDEGFGAVRHFQPADVRNLQRVSWAPKVLAGVLVLMGAAALAHAITSSLRRRRVDFAVLSALGLLRREVVAAAGWQATAMTAAALGPGILAGVVAGRWLWRATAAALGVIAEPVVPVAVAASVPVALAIANGVALLALRVADRRPVAAVLRAE